MEYIKLFLGIGLIIVFTWFLLTNIKRKGIVNALFRIDTIIGMVAGLYLVITSVNSIFFS